MDQSNNKSKLMQSFLRLVEVVEKLRGPEGCPWDREQTQRSLTPYVLEEAFELVEAIESGNQKDIQEELGDYLFQVILQAQVAQDENHFHLIQVIEKLTQKMIYRHPHVFQTSATQSLNSTDSESRPLSNSPSAPQSKSIEEVWKNWEALKQQEKKNSPGKSAPLFSYPKNLPALTAAAKIGNKTHRLRFDWRDPMEVLQKVKEELAELEVEIQPPKTELHRIQEEFGDLLFSMAQLGRHLKIDPEESLRAANRKFSRRFNETLEISGLNLEKFTDLPESEKEALWLQIKKREKSQL